MKTKMALLAIVLMSPALVQADKFVNGYTKKDGTYVQPHYRSDSNTVKYDNYSSQGNSNPYTGQQGYKPNEYSNPPSYNKSYGKDCYGNGCSKDD